MGTLLVLNSQSIVAAFAFATLAALIALIISVVLVRFFEAQSPPKDEHPTQFTSNRN